MPSNAPDIYYRMGLYNGADLTWNVVPGKVGYNSSSNAEHNPEIWTRNEIDGPTSSCAKIHLVWDDIIPPSSVAEIKYIDP